MTAANKLAEDKIAESETEAAQRMIADAGGQARKIQARGSERMSFSAMWDSTDGSADKQVTSSFPAWKSATPTESSTADDLTDHDHDSTAPTRDQRCQLERTC